MSQPLSATTASCHCGAVSIRLTRPPSEVVECNCSLCRRYGVLWAYFEASEVAGLPTEETSDTYAWNGRHVDFHRCNTCGCVTHWAPRSSRRSQLGINARLLEPDLLSLLPLRHKDGARTGKFLD